MTLRSELLGVVAAGRYSRQIASIGIGTAAGGSPGGTSVSPSWPTAQGAVAANVRNILAVALKPGTANGGSVSTPSGWTAIDDHIGGGYGGTLGDGTGNSRIYLFYRDNDNTNSGSVEVTVNSDGANGIVAATIARFEKLKGSWMPMVVAKAEATASGLVGTYVTAPDLKLAPGDVVYYGFAYVGTLAALTSGADLVALSPPQANGIDTTSGYDVSITVTGRRAQRGRLLGSQTLTLATGNCRGPLLAVRLRVR